MLFELPTQRAADSGVNGIRGSVSSCDAKQHFCREEDDRVCKDGGWLVSNRGFNGLLRRHFAGFHIQGVCNDGLPIGLLGGWIYQFGCKDGRAHSV